jgi:hypothetical protein
MSGRGGHLLLRTREGRDWKTGRTGVMLTVADTGTEMSTFTRIFGRFLRPRERARRGWALDQTRDS